MKTHVKFWIAAMLLVATSCSEKMDEQNRNNGSSPDTGQAYTRTLDEAVLYAQSMFDQNGVTRAGGLTLADYKIYNAASATRGGGDDVSFYVLNFADNGGYAIIPVDNRTTPVYAYSTTGNIDIDEAVENTGFGVFMENAVEYCNYEASVCPIVFPPDGLIPFPTDEIALYPLTELDGKMYHTKTETTTTTVGPLTTTLWGQRYPYNNFTPIKNGEHTPAGCTPIAMAQIMAYHEHPIFCDEYYLPWKDIKSSPKVYGNEYYAETVAYFIRDIGKKAGTSYGTGGSSTLKSRIRTTFKEYEYSVGEREKYDINVVISSLNKNYPVCVMGQVSLLNGHAWVIDGYHIRRIKSWYYETTPPYALYTTRTESWTYVNCNWGWSGDGDPTLCLSGVFEVEVWNNGKTENRNYSNDVEIIANIHL